MKFIANAAAGCGLLALTAVPSLATELVGAVQFDESHAFTKALREFERLAGECSGGSLTFNLHLNSELGLEKDYFENMSQGIAVDYAIVSPSHMSTFSQKAPLMDMPFLFRDLDHWNAAIEQGALEPLAQDVLEQANVRLIGYAGGGTRNLIVNRPITNMEELEGLPMRVMGAPIQTRIFEAIKAAPSVIAYSEVYNAIQTGVIDAAENEAAGIEQMKFYEVGPEISLTQHAITVRPLAISEATFQRLTEEEQACVLEAGAAAGKLGREIESGQDSEKLAAMEEAGYLKTHEFTERDKLLELAAPVKRAYAEELGALDVLEAIEAVE
ncbi:C4-dicarboxylate ABC transporter substrate-binding protein [Rhodobacteraceae bacterium 2CG4]|uniref:C4-dicarboxylate ABC transporter substrate-binding protein n=1 Tax=Halovulum marinum TaxID=2662447 RepID=A0A6L5YX95_9RHOB|nr:TRAP transporter substrate-binding protein [Halovulum marinum]MSU88465.1 C4-dicarboxylate ABC transporter substrate-binding protein [Halovulum marinum]